MAGRASDPGTFLLKILKTGRAAGRTLPRPQAQLAPVSVSNLPAVKLLSRLAD